VYKNAGVRIFKKIVKIIDVQKCISNIYLRYRKFEIFMKYLNYEIFYFLEFEFIPQNVSGTI